MMPLDSDKQSLTAHDERPGLVLELFVAGDNVYSCKARTALESMLETLDVLLPVKVCVIDVLKHPEAALTRQIFATPTLVVSAGDRRQMLVGDISARLLDLRGLVRQLMEAAPVIKQRKNEV